MKMMMDEDKMGVKMMSDKAHKKAMSDMEMMMAKPMKMMEKSNKKHG